MKNRWVGDVNASVVGLGTWVTGGSMWGGAERAESIAAIRAGIDAGISLIDTAPIYGRGLAEEIVGEAIVGRRDDVILSTKCGLNFSNTEGELFFERDDGDIYLNLTPAYIQQELEDSLRRLKTDYVDVYFTHWQSKNVVPIDETMGCLMDLKQQGKIKAIGASNTSLAHIKQYQAAGQLDVIQEEYSLLNRSLEETLLPYCEAQGIACFAYSPLAQGLLTGKIKPGYTFAEGDMRNSLKSFSDENLEKIANMHAQLQPIADAYGVNLAQLCIAWAYSQPGLTHVLCGARTLAQAQMNAGAGEVQLSVEDLAKIKGIAEGSGAMFGMFV